MSYLSVHLSNKRSYVYFSCQRYAALRWKQWRPLVAGESDAAIMTRPAFCSALVCMDLEVHPQNYGGLPEKLDD